MSALKSLKFSWKEATELKLEQLNEMDEFYLRAYERANLYKEKDKKVPRLKDRQTRLPKG